MSPYQTSQGEDNPYEALAKLEVAAEEAIKRGSAESKATAEQDLGRAMERMEEIDLHVKRLGEERQTEEKKAIQARQKLLKMCEAATRFFHEEQTVPPPDRWG